MLGKSFVIVISVLLCLSITTLILLFGFTKSNIYLNIFISINVSLTLLSCIFAFIINPGIIYSDKDKNDNEKIYCDTCKFLYPKNNEDMEHCFMCNICICNYDHHCDVIGKCVGKYNKILFYIFVLSSFAFVFSFCIVLFNFLLGNGPLIEKE